MFGSSVDAIDILEFTIENEGRCTSFECSVNFINAAAKVWIDKGNVTNLLFAKNLVQCKSKHMTKHRKNITVYEHSINLFWLFRQSERKIKNETLRVYLLATFP